MMWVVRNDHLPLSKQKLKIMKFNYQVLEVDHIEYELNEEQKQKYLPLTHITMGVYTKSCTIKDKNTGEIFKIIRETASNNKLRLINIVDYNDLIIGDQFHLGFPFEQ